MPVGNTDTDDIIIKKSGDLVSNKKFDEALSMVDEVLLSHPANDMAWVAKGVILTYQKKYDDAYGAFDHAVSINPDNQKAIQHREMIAEYKRGLEPANPIEIDEMALQDSQTWDIREYQPNIILYIWPCIGALFFFGGIWGGLISLAISSVLIYYDAGKMGAGTYPGIVNPLSWRPWEWGVITFFFWIVGYPLYLYKRREIFDTTNHLQRTSSSSVKLVAGVIGFAIILSVMGFGLYHSTGSPQDISIWVTKQLNSKNPNQPISISTDFTRVTHVSVSTVVGNWDENAGSDGITVYPDLRNAKDQTVQWGGTTLPVDIEIWAPDINSDPNEAAYVLVCQGSSVITSWKDGNPTMNGGIRIPFSSMDITEEQTTGRTYVTVHTPDGKSYSGIDNSTSLSP